MCIRDSLIKMIEKLTNTFGAPGYEDEVIEVIYQAPVWHRNASPHAPGGYWLPDSGSG